MITAATTGLEKWVRDIHSVYPACSICDLHDRFEPKTFRITLAVIFASLLE